MERVNRKRAPKGSVTVRKKGNSYEARVTLELVNLIEGVDKNPRLSRTATTEAEAKRRLGKLVTDVYYEAQQKSNNVRVFSDECVNELEKFEEYQKEKTQRKVEDLADDYTLFPNIAKEWLNWKKRQINPNTNKTISPKTVETYIGTIQNHIMIDFRDYHLTDITKEVVEDYINKIRQKTPRLAKDLFLITRSILNYARDERHLINDVPKFNIKFSKRKRSKKAQMPYLTAKRQEVWLDTFEQDKREFAYLFSTLLQTGMRPEEGCGLKWKCVCFEKNIIIVENAFKDITLYDDDMNIIGHESQDGDLKTEESYRNIPMSKRLRKMLKKIKEDKMEDYEFHNKKWDESDYVFLNQLGKPYTPERLQNKIKQFIKKYNLEHMTVYGFRHSYATLMSEMGMDREVLRELMGHSEFETTDFYYIHISEERKRKEFDRVNDNIFQGKKEQNKGKKFYVVKKKKALKLA